MLGQIGNWKPIGKFFRGCLEKRVQDFVPNPKYHELQDPVYYGSPRSMELDQRAEWPLTDPDLLEFTRRLFVAARKINLPLYVHTAYRAPEVQEALKLNGYSQVVSGPHQRGAAVDIVHSHYNWQAPEEFWEWIGRQGKAIIADYRLPIEWGGDFKTLYDPAHWQLKDWRSRDKISVNALHDRNDAIVWKRSPFSKSPAEPYRAGQLFYSYLDQEGRKWKSKKN